MGRELICSNSVQAIIIVGNDVPVFMSNLLYSLGSQGAITPRQSSVQNIRTEKTHSLEIGFDSTFLQRTD